MNALFYILKRSLINVIRGLARKPAALIAYIVVALFFIGIFIMSGLQGGTDIKYAKPDTVMAIFVAYIVFIFAISLMASLANGASFFRLADVNFLFTAPVKPGNILIYGFIKQVAINIGVMVFMAFQFPTWKKILGLQDGAGFILALAYILIIVVTSFVSITLYSFTSRKPKRRRRVKTAIYAGLAAFLAPAVFEALKSGNLLEGAINWFSADTIRYIPLIGWIRQILLGTLTGVTPSVLFNTLLVLLLSAALFLYLYKMDTDFYEDAQANTESREQIVKAFREGKAGSITYSNAKYRKVKFEFTMEGSKAIFQKQLLMQKKTGIGFIGIKTLVLLACAVIATFSIKVEPGILLMIFLGASIYIMMIFTMIGSWVGEFSKHYIYLIPASSFSKMIYSTLTDIISIVIEGTLILGVSGILAKCPAGIIITAIAAYSIIGAVFIYSDLFVRRLFGKIHAKTLRVFFRIVLLIFILIPGIVPAAVIIALTENYALAFLATAGINSLLVLLFMSVGVGLFDHPEFEG